MKMAAMVVVLANCLSGQGFDFLGGGAIFAGGSSHFAMSNSSPGPLPYGCGGFICAQTWSPSTTVSANRLWVAVETDAPDLSFVGSNGRFRVSIWQSPNDFVASPDSGWINFLYASPSQSIVHPASGSLLWNRDVFEIGFDIPAGVALYPQFDYVFAVSFEYNFSQSLVPGGSAAHYGVLIHQSTLSFFGFPSGGKQQVWRSTENLSCLPWQPSTPGGRNPFAFRLEASFTPGSFDLGGGCGPAGPTLTSTLPALGSNLTITASGFSPASTPLLFASTPPLAPSFVGTCPIHVDTSTMIQVTPLAPILSGSTSTSLFVPALPALGGQVFNLQMAGVGSSLELSNGLQLTLW